MVQKEFRKPPRYMVGDIVYSHGFICIVCSVYPFNIDYSYDLKVIDGQSLGKICQNDIMHVHIWEEFLKKNGWKKFKRPYSSDYCYRRKGYPTLNIRSEKEVYFHWGDHDKSITAVHQLQHLLFGLGINHKMKV